MTRHHLLALAVLAAGRPALADDSLPDATATSEDLEPTQPPPLGEVTDVAQLSLADLLDTRVAVASRRPQTARETPGIVTVITREDIIGMGARDLIDVLELVPGFAPGVDVEGVVDFGIRGQWGHEGKILLLIDGQPMNELLYSTLQLANHYPLEAIERIEVIRGPGSAIYGGFAELAVINIITRDATMNGVAVASDFGQLGNAVGHADLTLTFGTTDTGVRGLSAAGTFSIGHATSNGLYRDMAGTSYALDGNSSRDPMFAKLALGYGHAHFDAIIDNYAIQTRDGVGPVIAATAAQGFRGYYVDARYDLPLRSDLTLTPHVELIRQSPWNITDRSSDLFYTKTVTRYTAGMRLSYDPTQRINLQVGAETYADRAHVNDPTEVGFQTLFGGELDQAYDTIATYAQVMANHPIANLTIGARYEHMTSVGGSLVPRVALTRVVGKFHAKLLAAQAFREPGIENLNLTGDALRPEKTTVFEGELGCELTSHMFLAVNAFDITTKDPIVYAVNPQTLMEEYDNYARTGTRGVEVDYRVKYARGHLAASYSYYTAAGKNDVTSYAVPGHDDALLAFPPHKLTMSGSLKLYKGLSFNPSAVIFGHRYGYTEADAAGNAMVERFAPTALVNAYLMYRDLLVPGLELGAGVFDLADQHLQYIQPYDGGHPPLPASGRELVFRVGYEHRL